MADFDPDAYLKKKESEPFDPNAYLKSKEGAAVPADNSKYKDNPVSTFAANAINSLTFGLPDYLNKTFTPETYAETQKYNEANPMAATAGDVAGYVVPTGAGAIKGAQLGARVAPKIAQGLEHLLGSATTSPKIINDISKYVATKFGQGTGGILGAQTGAALPGVVQGDAAKAAAGAEAINNLPYVPSLPGPAQHAVPALAVEAANAVNGGYQRVRNAVTNMATGYTPTPQEARNILDSNDERMINTYGGRLKLQGLASTGPNAINSGFSQELNRLGR